MENKDLGATWTAKVFVILSLESLIFINTNTTISIIPLFGVQEIFLPQGVKWTLAGLEICGRLAFLLSTGKRSIGKEDKEKVTIETTERIYMNVEIENRFPKTLPRPAPPSPSPPRAYQKSIGLWIPPCLNDPTMFYLVLTPKTTWGRELCSSLLQ